MSGRSNPKSRMNDLRGLWASRILTIAAALLIFAGSGPHRSVAEVRDTTGVSDLTNTEVKAVVARSNWNRDSYELAAELYVASAGERLSVGDGPRAAADLQAAARINNILGNYERAAQQIISSISSDSSG